MTEYTQPDLRETLKKRIEQGSKGGKAGQWSARKAQLLAAEYKNQGGGYRGKKKKAQQHLDAWTHEKWMTSDGTKAIRHGKTKRYLPAKAWDALSPAQKKSTERKKETASKRGEQYVSNTTAAKKARKKASRSGKPRGGMKQKPGAAWPQKATRAAADRAVSTRAAAKRMTGAGRRKKATRQAASRTKAAPNKNEDT